MLISCGEGAADSDGIRRNAEDWFVWMCLAILTLRNRSSEVTLQDAMSEVAVLILVVVEGADQSN